MKHLKQQPILIKAIAAISLLVIILLFRKTLDSFSSYYQTKSSYQLLRDEIKKTDQKIDCLSKNISEVHKITDYDHLSSQAFIAELKDSQIIISPEAETPSQFQDNLRKDVALLKKQFTDKEIVLPENFFLGLNQYESHLPSTKEIEKLQQQKILVTAIAKELLTYPRIKIEQFELQDETCNNHNHLLARPLGYLIITITIEELPFQKLFNNIVNNYYFFIIEKLSIVNSNPFSPRHASENNSPLLSIQPLFGREKITVTLTLQLLNTFDNKEATSSFKTNKEKLLWKRTKDDSPLFVSRHYILKGGLLIDPLKDQTMLHPPVPNEWFINNNLDYCNPNILSEDNNHNGFTNLEKWLGSNPLQEPGKFSSDPNDPHSHPLLWTKLRCYQNDITKNSYDFYFCGYDNDSSEKIFQLQPNTAVPNIDAHSKPIFNAKIRYVKLGEKLAGLPLQVMSYEEKKITYKNIYYDASELIVVNPNTQEQWTLIKKSTYHPEPTHIVCNDAICFHDQLFVPPKIIKVKRGDFFKLETFIPPNENTSSEKRETELYQLIDIKNNEVIIKKDNQQYRIPIVSTEGR